MEAVWAYGEREDIASANILLKFCIVTNLWKICKKPTPNDFNEYSESRKGRIRNLTVITSKNTIFNFILLFNDKRDKKVITKIHYHVHVFFVYHALSQIEGVKIVHTGLFISVRRKSISSQKCTANNVLQSKQTIFPLRIRCWYFSAQPNLP
jgi:hypothetical protein